MGSGEQGAGRAGEDEGDKANNQCPMPNTSTTLSTSAPCPMPHAQCPMPNAPINVCSVFGVKRRGRVLGRQNGFFQCREFGSLRDLYQQVTLHHRVVLVKWRYE